LVILDGFVNVIFIRKERQLRIIEGRIFISHSRFDKMSRNYSIVKEKRCIQFLVIVTWIKSHFFTTTTS
jgi:hypothetical protein